MSGGAYSGASVVVVVVGGPIVETDTGARVDVTANANVVVVAKGVMVEFAGSITADVVDATTAAVLVDDSLVVVEVDGVVVGSGAGDSALDNDGMPTKAVTPPSTASATPASQIVNAFRR